jgi:hypothetical protein
MISHSHINTAKCQWIHVGWQQVTSTPAWSATAVRDFGMFAVGQDVFIFGGECKLWCAHVCMRVCIYTHTHKCIFGVYVGIVYDVVVFQSIIHNYLNYLKVAPFLGRQRGNNQTKPPQKHAYTHAHATCTTYCAANNPSIDSTLFYQRNLVTNKENSLQVPGWTARKSFGYAVEFDFNRLYLVRILVFGGMFDGTPLNDFIFWSADSPTQGQCQCQGLNPPFSYVGCVCVYLYIYIRLYIRMCMCV